MSDVQQTADYQPGRAAYNTSLAKATTLARRFRPGDPSKEELLRLINRYQTVSSLFFEDKEFLVYSQSLEDRLEKYHEHAFQKLHAVVKDEELKTLATLPNAFYLVKHTAYPTTEHKWFSALSDDVKLLISNPSSRWLVVGFGVSRFIFKSYSNNRTRLELEFFCDHVTSKAYSFSAEDARSSVLVLSEADPTSGRADWERGRASSLERTIKALLKFSEMRLSKSVDTRNELFRRSLCLHFNHPACRVHALPGWADETMLVHESLWKSLSEGSQSKSTETNVNKPLEFGLIAHKDWSRLETQLLVGETERHEGRSPLEIFRQNTCKAEV